MSKQVEKYSAIPDVADEVRDFYELYPYPRPVDSLDKYRRLWQDRQRRRADYHLFWPARTYREDQSILVAGCGTSQAAKHALRWPAAQVTGIDFSKKLVVLRSFAFNQSIPKKDDVLNAKINPILVLISSLNLS